MIKLTATFENGAGRKHNLSIKDPDTSKSAEEIKASLEKFSALNLFEKNGVAMFQKVVTAKYVEKKETVIFNKQQEQQEKQLVKSVPEERITPTPSTKLQSPLQAIKDPKDLILEQELIKPGFMRMLFQLPKGIEPNDISEMEAMSLVLAMLPKGADLEDIRVVEGTEPVRFQLIVKLQEASARPKQASSPPKKKKKRRRLLDRLGKTKTSSSSVG